MKKKEGDETRATSDMGDVGKITAEAFEKMTKSGIPDVSSCMEASASSATEIHTPFCIWSVDSGWASSTPSWTCTYSGPAGEDEDGDCGDPVPVETGESAPTIPAYADGFMPHLVRAKEEGVRRGIEGDTIVIDRGVAISQGVDHADMILGLKVKYAKEGALPMDSAFVIFKDKEKDKEKERACTEKKIPAAAEKKDPPRFIKYAGDDGPCLLAIDRIITARHVYLEDPGTKMRHWNHLEVFYEVGSQTDVLRVVSRSVADNIWKTLCLTTDEDRVDVVDSSPIPVLDATEEGGCGTSEE